MSPTGAPQNTGFVSSLGWTDEAFLHTSEERLRDLLATLDLGAFMARDLNGTIRFWSEGCARLYGWTAAEAVGQPAHVLLNTRFPAPLTEIEATLERHGEWSGDLCQRTRSGAEVIIYAHKVPRRNAQGRIQAVLETVTDVTAHRRAEEGRQLLIRELNHRVKNLFAVVSGMINMTARNTQTTREMADVLSGRVMALARAHELIRPALTAEAPGLKRALLGELVAAVVTPHVSPCGSQLRTEGPVVEIGSGSATSLALILHELATNAAKYGALSVVDGRLKVCWKTDSSSLTLLWLESGGPPVEAPPTHQGFGSQLARMSASGQLGGSIEYEWARSGVTVTMKLPLERFRD